jgi:hypothetical protein
MFEYMRIFFYTLLLWLSYDSYLVDLAIYGAHQGGALHLAPFVYSFLYVGVSHNMVFAWMTSSLTLVIITSLAEATLRIRYHTE